MTTNLPSSDELIDAASGLQDDTVELRRAIHHDPELGLELPRTQNKILDAITDLGLDVTLGETTTSVVADLDSGKPGPTILLRADMDALPMDEDLDVPYRSANEGAMHACGHDAHVAMLVGAARVLVENRNELTGRIRFMFQPGEEGFHGARHMIEEGVTEGVDRAFAIHIFSTAPSGLTLTRRGPLMASADKFEITVNGRGGHASQPHFTHDPIPAAAQIITGLHTMVGRDVDPNLSGLLTVAHVEAGTTNNVIPEHAFMEGTIRTLDEMSRQSIKEGVERVAAGVAAAHKCTCTVEIEQGYPVTVNHDGEADRVAEVARAALGDRNYVDMPRPVMGAEDWSYVLNEVPGAMAFLGACPKDVDDPRQAAPNHSNYMRIDEDAMINGVALYTAMAMAG